MNNMINAFIVDDEENNRDVLKKLLADYCPNINIIGETDNVDDAYNLISSLTPQLIFLDVKMPVSNGFDLLKRFNKIDFEVIFVTAYNEFAINAFEFNAIGYILKPIDCEFLIKTVAKAEMVINSNPTQRVISDFIETLNVDNSLVTKVSVHHHDRVIFINFEDIVSVVANEGYCEIYTTNGEKYFSTKELKLYENVFKGYDNLLRVNRSCIINLTHIKSYSKGESCLVELTNSQSIEIPRRKKSEILNKIKTV